MLEFVLLIIKVLLKGEFSQRLKLGLIHQEEVDELFMPSLTRFVKFRASKLLHLRSLYSFYLFIATVISLNMFLNYL